MKWPKLGNKFGVDGEWRIGKSVSRASGLSKAGKVVARGNPRTDVDQGDE